MCVCPYDDDDDVLCSFVFMNNSLDLFCRLRIRCAKLQDHRLETNSEVLRVTKAFKLAPRSFPRHESGHSIQLPSLHVQ